MSCLFKKGDIITPISKRVQSNYHVLKNIKRLEVLHVHYLSDKNSYMTVKLVKGTATSSYYGPTSQGAELTVYANAFQLANEVEPEYSIW